MSSEMQTQYYHHGRFKVAGGILPDAVTAYRTYGDSKNPCIVFPTCYGGRLDSEQLGSFVSENIGIHVQTRCVETTNEDEENTENPLGTHLAQALNPEKYYIVTFALFSNGESSSPSNTKAPYNGPYFPAISYEDNVRAQHVVLAKKLGIEEVFAVIGFSMGAQQVIIVTFLSGPFSTEQSFVKAYYWGVMYPELVQRHLNFLLQSNDCTDFLSVSFVVICGSARTSPHNQCFIEGPKSALLASKDFDDGHYTSTPQHGIRAFGRAYSAWAYGQTWYRDKQYLYDGKYTDLNSFLREDWEAGFLDAWDANDMITLINTWQQGDVSLVRHGGDFQKCLSEIKPRALIMPCKTDLYFPPEDSEIEVSLMKKKADLFIIDSVWGHMAGGGSNSVDDAAIFSKIKEFFGSV
ncbi:hypothetical protein EW146_g929 [Bondarzewia mesenterica]|uniref:AB hydrolase-1 domain-containing protein n=1 Tax=Bondarzewia mesenterica TaxID=1095465 RepID=A0A4S4M5E4_9AGAM|nr:hypothetical protein EW146_g929 [Bondarzewia mesenterica]